MLGLKQKNRTDHADIIVFCSEICGIRLSLWHRPCACKPSMKLFFFVFLNAKAVKSVAKIIVNDDAG